MCRWSSSASAGAALLALGACSGPNNSDVNIIEGKTANRPEPQPIRVLSEPEIKTALSGRTFQYTLPQGNGMITYNADGSLSFQDDAKGAGTGTWLAQEGRLCEAIGKAPQQ